MFGTAFKDAQWDENLGVVKAIVLRNRVELLEHELKDVSQKIEELEKSRRMGEVVKHMTIKDMLSTLDEEDNTRHSLDLNFPNPKSLNT